MRNIKYHLLSIALLCAVSASELQADAGGYLDMSLETLLATPVSIASRHDTALKYSASTVYQFGREELDGLGLKNIYELLNYVPGFHVTRTIDFADTSRIHIRGIDNRDHGYLLVMLNGIAMNEISLSRAQVYLPFIPLKLIEKVEVIAGPGAAIYGNNAYLGVLNVVTRTKDSEVSLAMGTNDGYELSGLFSTYLDDDERLRFSGGYYDYQDDGFDYLFTQDQPTQDPRHHRNFFSSLEYNNWRADFGWSESLLDDFIQFANIGNGSNRFEVDTYYLKVLNEWHLNSDWQVDSSFYFTQHDIDQVVRFGEVTATDGVTRNDLFGPFGRSQAFNLSLDSRYEISPTQQFRMGASLLRRGQAFAGLNRNHDRTNNGAAFQYLGGVRSTKRFDELSPQEEFFNTYGLYAQYVHQFSDFWRSTVGLRHDYYELTDEHTTNPRLALIYTPSESTTMKFIYGSAYRVPSTEEMLSRSADPNIRSETIHTSELSINKSFERVDYQLTYFHNGLDNLIEQQTKESGESELFTNVGDRDVSGMEGSAIWDLSEDLRLKLNHTHVIKEVEETQFQDFSSLILNYRYGDSWSTAISATYRSSIKEEGFSEGGVTLANMKLTYKLNNKSSAYLACNNLFDTSYNDYVPALASRFDASLPGRGRECRLGLQYSL